MLPIKSSGNFRNCSIIAVPWGTSILVQFSKLNRSKLMNSSLAFWVDSISSVEFSWTTLHCLFDKSWIYFHINKSEFTRVGQTIDKLASTRAVVHQALVVEPEPSQSPPVALAEAVNFVHTCVLRKLLAGQNLVIVSYQPGWSLNDLTIGLCISVFK